MAPRTGELGCVIKVVTTMNAAGWNQTGGRMVKSFREQWPTDVELIVYAEGFNVPAYMGVTTRRLPAWQEQFKARHRGNIRANGQMPSRYDYRYDAVKFSHKVGAIVDAGLSQADGVMIWLDADTFTHAPVTHEWLHRLFPPPSYIAWLNRTNSYPECGFVMFRCDHRSHKTAMVRYQDYYTSNAVLELPQTHDSWVMQHLIDGMARAKEIEPPVSLSGDPTWSHPFVNGPLGACMDHMKGDRKKRGRSSKWDTRVRRTEPYWRIKGA